jgi:hypothetical protein
VWRHGSRTPDLKMLDGWGRRRDLPDKSDGAAVAGTLSQQWEEQGPLADGGSCTAPPPPCWLMATQGKADSDRVYASVDTQGALEEGSVEGDDAQQEEARVQWLRYHLQQGEWSKAAEIAVTETERDELARMHAGAS